MPPVAGIGADHRVNARFLRRIETQLLHLARLQQMAGQENLVRARHEGARRGVRRRGRLLGGEADLLQTPGCRMARLCGIRSKFSKRNSTGLPACTTNTSRSKDIRSGSVPTRTTRTPNSPNSVRIFLAWSDGKQRRQGVGELHRFQGDIRGTVLNGNLADGAEQLIHQCRRLFLRPELRGTRCKA